MRIFHRLTWSTLGGAHVLDYIEMPLERPDGTIIALTRSGMDFVVKVAGEEALRTRDNTLVCRLLNDIEAGLRV